MERKELFKKYHIRLIIEGLLKSLVCGFIIGFFASLIPAIITLIYNANGLWYSLAVGFGVGIIGTVLFYFIAFRPTTKQVASRIDRIGLEDRAVTMLQLEGNDSFMATLQRDDAKERIRATNHKGITFRIFKIPVIILAVVALCAITMTTISATSVERQKPYNPIPRTGRPIEEDEIEYITLQYLPHPDYIGGDVDENSYQIIERGTDALPVVATPWPGFIFYGWTDLVLTAERTDRRVAVDFVVYAVFLAIPDVDNKDITEPGEPEPIIKVNNIIDGTTYYGHDFEKYYDVVIDMLTASGNELTAEQRAMIELYFDTMNKLK